VPWDRKQRIMRAVVEHGMSFREAGRQFGVNERTIAAWYKGWPTQREMITNKATRDPLPPDKLTREARKGLGPQDIGPHPTDDNITELLNAFLYWRRRYTGRLTTPAMRQAARAIIAHAYSAERAYIVINCPPGIGKSQLIADLVAWEICRDRSLRFIIGGASARTTRTAAQVRNLLTAKTPLKAKRKDLVTGRAVDAEATLVADYGRFRPDQSSGRPWRAEEFTVATLGDDEATDKDPTVAVYGLDSTQIGHRCDRAYWDDPWTPAIERSPTQAANTKADFDDVSEERIDDGGLVAVIQQRLGPGDISRHCLDKRIPHGEAMVPMYTHIVYPGHIESLCTGHHPPDASPYDPTSPRMGDCLLDPIALPWRDLVKKQVDPRKYRVVIQQEDVDPASVLVQQAWIDGGTCPLTGEYVPGCWDDLRGLWELPDNLTGDLTVVGTVDPSGEKWWALEAWAFQRGPGVEFDYLLDCERRQMTAGALLDWDAATHRFTGLMEEWQTHSEQPGRRKITHWVVEINAAQRYLLQYQHVRRWRQLHDVRILPHSSGLNKADQERGIETLGSRYRTGAVRLPGRGPLVRDKVAPLVAEATHWTAAGRGWPTDDMLMAQWFGVFQLPNIVTGPSVLLQRDVPSWVGKSNVSPLRGRRMA
jgi:hypothetical protein